MNDFTPSWKLKGLKNIEEGFKAVFDSLVAGRKKITSKSLDGTAVFQWRDKTITINGKTKGVGDSKKKTKE